MLQSLRSDRRRARTVEERKPLTFMIQTKHKQELQIWKTLKVNELKSSWKTLPRTHTTTHQRVAGHPVPNGFADMLEQLFAAAAVDRNCLGEGRCAQGNKADETTKIS